MKKRLINVFSVSVFTFLFACSSNDGAEEIIVVEPSQPKKEVIKDYNYFLDRIKNDEAWMIEVRKQAEAEGITEDEMLTKNAKFMAKQNGFDTEDPNKELYQQIDKIMNNEEWYNSIVKEAETRGISVDSMLVKAARFTINEKKK